MNPKDILSYVDSLHREKNIDKELVFIAIESAFQTAAKRQYGEEADIVVKLDRDSGRIDAAAQRRAIVRPDWQNWGADR